MGNVIRLQAALIFSFLLLGTNASAQNRRVEGYGFSVELPEGVAIIKRPLDMDFEVYEISLDGRNLIGIYVGNAPNWHGGNETSAITNPAVFEDKTGRREYLYKPTCLWPSFIHAWETVDYSQIPQARVIAKSIQLTDCPNS